MTEALSVVIIGKNEEAHLGKALASVRAIPMECDVVYVDSASDDRSVNIAGRSGARVAKLDPSPYLCAAAGRHIGTLVARAPWILYLDGDMQLAPEFARRIPEFLRAAAADPKIGGFVGIYRNAHEGGTTRDNLLRQRLDQTTAATFGGAVLASRAAVLAAASWDVHVSSYEELDLHSRLAARGFAVRFVPELMVTHRTSRTQPLRTFLELFLPFGKHGRRMRGIGQLVRSRLRARSLVRFMGFYPYPFVYLSLVVAGIVVAVLPFHGAPAGLALPAIGALYVARARGIPSTVVYLSFPLRIALGVFDYPAGWEPSYSLVPAEEIREQQTT
jgi:glycosyltransferase involved in cell wall biosynthesis